MGAKAKGAPAQTAVTTQAAPAAAHRVPATHVETAHHKETPVLCYAALQHAAELALAQLEFAGAAGGLTLHVVHASLACAMGSADWKCNLHLSCKHAANASCCCGSGNGIRASTWQPTRGVVQEQL